jgi:hypothetical protein
MVEQEIREHLVRKLAVLERIAANTETQERFIRRREMRGLGRLLRERAVLIDELAAVNERLAGERLGGLLADEARALNARQREIVAACEHVIRQAMAERIRIAGEIAASRTKRRMNNVYFKSNWQVMARGSCLNVKG